MSEINSFQSALSNFVTDAACGGAVRHLADIGYTLDQIVERLDYPAPREKVQKIMMAYLYESRVLMRKEPSKELFAAKEQFVQEQDAFGRRSMRKIIVDRNSQTSATEASDLGSMKQGEKAAQTQDILWKESIYDPRRDGKLTELLHQKCGKNGETYSYIACPFGELFSDRHSQIEKNGNAISCLNSRQREYLQGIRWDQPVLYHRLDQRMREIIGKLYEAGAYSGAGFFAVSREKITILPK